MGPCRRRAIRSSGWRRWSTSSCCGASSTRRSMRRDRAKGGLPAAVRCGHDVQDSGAADALHALGRPDRYQLNDRLSFMRFAGLALEDRVPDAKTIWLYREQLTRAGAIERLFARFDAALRDAGYLAMGGQIVDATVVEARRPRRTGNEKATVKSGGVPEAWSQAKRAQMDTDGRWTIKRGRQHPPRRRRAAGARRRRDRGAGVRLQEPSRDRPPAWLHSPLRGHRRRDTRWPPARPGLDPDNTASPVWADSAYRSAANRALLARRGLVPQFQRPKPRGKPMPPHLAAATRHGRGCGSPSSTSSPPRSAALAWSSARSASPAPPPGSALPTWPPT